MYFKLDFVFVCSVCVIVYVAVIDIMYDGILSHVS